MRLIAGVLASLLCLIVFANVARAATVDPPLRVKITKLDRTDLSGMITSYSDDGFEFMDTKKQTQKLTWEELPPQAVFNLNNQLIRKGTADDWIKVAKKLLTMPGGRGPAERAFQRASQIEPK